MSVEEEFILYFHIARASNEAEDKQFFLYFSAEKGYLQDLAGGRMTPEEFTNIAGNRCVEARETARIEEERVWSVFVLETESDMFVVLSGNVVSPTYAKIKEKIRESTKNIVFLFHRLSLLNSGAMLLLNASSMQKMKDGFDVSICVDLQSNTMTYQKLVNSFGKIKQRFTKVSA